MYDKKVDEHYAIAMKRRIAELEEKVGKYFKAIWYLKDSIYGWDGKLHGKPMNPFDEMVGSEMRPPPNFTKEELYKKIEELAEFKCI